MKKRLLSIFLIVCLCAALLPTAALAADGDKWDGWTDLKNAPSYTLTEGEYYLSSDLNLGMKQILIAGNVTIDLNGNVLSFTRENDIITVYDGNLTLLDSKPETPHTITLEDRVGNTSVTKTIQGGVVHAAIINFGIGIASENDRHHPALTLKGGTVFGKVGMSCIGTRDSSSTFYADGGTVLGEMDVGSGCKLTRHEDAADYTTFKGNVYDSIDATVEDAAKIPVTFDANGGTFDNDDKSVKLHFFKGKNLEKPDADPTKAGCTFGGWYTETKDPDDPTKTVTTAWSGETTVTAPMTFTAKWLPTVSGSHDADGFTATVVKADGAALSSLNGVAKRHHLNDAYINAFSIKYVDADGKAPTEATTLTISGVDRSKIAGGKPVYVIVAAGMFGGTYRAELDKNDNLRFTMDGRNSGIYLSRCTLAITQSKYRSELAVSLKLPQQLQKSEADTYQFQYTVDFTVDRTDNFKEWYTQDFNLDVNGTKVPPQGTSGSATVSGPWGGSVPESKGTLDITATLDDAARSTGKLSAYASLTLDPQTYSHSSEHPLFISPTLYSDVSLVKFVDSDAADAKVLDVYLAATGSLFDKPITEPKREEYDFAGWYYKDADGAEHPFDGTIAVAGEMIIYAKWAEPFGGAAGLAAILDDVPFVDVSFRDYYYDAVKWAYHAGVTGGTDAWHFSPDAGCTRAQAVTFLWRAAGCPSASYLGNFTDVDADAYYAPAVAWAVANGVTNGTSATTFSPEAACSRGDIVTFLFRAFGGTSNGYHPFADVPASAYYADAVAWAYEHGVTGGTSSTTFSPADACSRAQIVTFLYRVLG